MQNNETKRIFKVKTGYVEPKGVNKMNEFLKIVVFSVFATIGIFLMVAAAVANDKAGGSENSGLIIIPIMMGVYIIGVCMGILPEGNAE